MGAAKLFNTGAYYRRHPLLAATLDDLAQFMAHVRYPIRRNQCGHPKPLPFVNANAIGIMLSFLIRFIPTIMTEYHRISQAGRARLIDANRNPLFRIRYQVIPLMRNLFQTSEEFAEAMTARCYSSDRTDPEFAFQRNDLVALLVLLFVCAILVGSIFWGIPVWRL